MPTVTAQARHNDPVVQFSVFTPNRLGRLRDLMAALNARRVQVLALTVLDTTDSAILRLVVDDPEQARALLQEEGFPFSERPLVAVEMDTVTDLNRLTTALLEAELNINYLYSFRAAPHGKPVGGLSAEDNEMAEQVLKQHQLRTLRQGDLSR